MQLFIIKCKAKDLHKIIEAIDFETLKSQIYNL